jgi:hypothetical protein
MEAYEITLLSVCLCIAPKFLFFYEARIVSKERGRLVLPRISCCILIYLLIHLFMVYFIAVLLARATGIYRQMRR